MLSSVFFFSFAAVQLPLGVAIDRYGPLRCMLASLGLAVERLPDVRRRRVDG
jgi:MFS family permease